MKHAGRIRWISFAPIVLIIMAIVSIYTIAEAIANRVRIINEHD